MYYTESMSNFLEVEVKYDATGISMRTFKKFIEEYTHKSVDSKYLKGTDIYYNKGKIAIRHRHTDENQEITVKKRHSKRTLTVRTEANVTLSDLPQDKNLGKFLKLIGYRQKVTLKKEYLIFKAPYMEGYIEFVWYKVRSKGKPTRSFIEIEVHGTPDDVEILDEFKKGLEKGLGLSKNQVLNKSLYELYA